MQTTLRPLRTWLISALMKSCACMRSADQKEYKVIIQFWSVFHVLLGAFSGNKQFGYCLDTFVTGFIHELTRECFTENQITKAWFLSTNFIFVNCKMCFTFFNSGNSRKLTVTVWAEKPAGLRLAGPSVGSAKRGGNPWSQCLTRTTQEAETQA